MAGDMRFQLSNNLDPLQTLDICHEIVNMTFCTSEKNFNLKKCAKKICLSKYDSSESSDSGVSTFITKLRSPLTPDSLASEYSIPSSEENDTKMIQPQNLANSTDQNDIPYWKNGNWTNNFSDIQLFPDNFDNTNNYCDTSDKSISNIEIIKNVLDNTISNHKLNIFKNSLKINDLYSSLNETSECDVIPNKCTLNNSKSQFPKEIINNIPSNILDDKNCSTKTCSNNFDIIPFLMNNNSIKDEKLKCESFDKLNKSISDNESDNSTKKKCFDQTLPKKGRYFMRSSSGVYNDIFKSKISHLLDQNKNVHGLTCTKSKGTPNNSITKHPCNVSLRNNEQINYSTKKVPDFNSSKIRFPNLDSHWISLNGFIVCRWTNCNNYFNTSAKLIEHIQCTCGKSRNPLKHVNSQTDGETFVCLWSDCKVYNKSSCSRSWLERHILTHCGNKPLHCIVQKCRQRFSSQIMLERHVNRHFKSSNNNKEDDNLIGKLVTRKGKKIRFRKQPFTARKFDYFDKVTMMKLQTQLFLSTQNSQQDFIDYSRRSIKFYPKIIARRILVNRKQELLISWCPPNILDDEWIICDKNVNLEMLERVIPIMKIDSDKRDSITQLFGNIFPPSFHHSRK